MKNKIISTKYFLKEFFRNPSHVGSVCASSKFLASAMIQYIPFAKDGLIIDLGAGSGAITRQLLESGIEANRILAIDRTNGFEKAFNENCKGVPLCIGDACQLEDVLNFYAPNQKVCAIISSLPFRVMPDEIVCQVLSEIKKIVNQHNSILVQYSYAWWKYYPLKNYGFSPNSKKMVIRNLPPARVEMYTA